MKTLTSSTVLPFHAYDPEEIPNRLGELGFDTETVGELIDGWLSVASLDLLASYHPVPKEIDPFSDVRKGNASAPHCLVDPYTGFFIWKGKEGQIVNYNIGYGGFLLRAKSFSETLFQRAMQNRTLELCQGVDIAQQLFFDRLDAETQRLLSENVVPEVIVHTPGEFSRLVDDLQKRNEQLPGGQLWFRGQTEDYLLPDRTPLVKKWITPWSDLRDSSLVPNLYRCYDQHLASLEDWERLILELSGWAMDANQVLPEQFTLHDIETGEPVELLPVPADTKVVMEFVYTWNGP